MAYAQVTFADAQDASGRRGSSDADRTAALKYWATSMPDKSIILPSGLNFQLTETITVTNRKVGILGDDAGAKPIIRVNRSVGFDLRLGARIQNIRFDATTNGVTLLRLGGSAASGNEDDTDGSVDECVFNLRSSCTAINYNGRNCNVNNNIFQDSGTSNIGLLLRWDGIANDGTDDGDGQDVGTSMRKNRFWGNQVDLEFNCQAIVAAPRDGAVYGLLITDNKFQKGCQILSSEQKGVDGVCIADNVWGAVRANYRIGSEGVMEFATGKATGVIYNNLFYGVRESNSIRPLRYIRTSSSVTPGLAITRNLFDRTRDGKDAIQLNSGTKSRVVAYENTIRNGSSSSAGNNGVTNGAVKFSN